jgi:hypothetical protein
MSFFANIPLVIGLAYYSYQLHSQTLPPIKITHLYCIKLFTRINKKIVPGEEGVVNLK